MFDSQNTTFPSPSQPEKPATSAERPNGHGAFWSWLYPDYARKNAQTIRDLRAMIAAEKASAK